MLIESTYEGEHDAKPERIRWQAWAAMLYGAAGQFFGNNPMWHFDGPTLFPYAGDWRQALDSIGSRDMSRLGAFFSSRTWWDLMPARDDLTSAPGASAARSADGRLAVVYVPASGDGPTGLTVNLHALAPTLRAQWFNPARDEPPRDEGSVSTNRDCQRLQTPGDNGAGVNDWVLVLEAR